MASIKPALQLKVSTTRLPGVCFYRCVVKFTGLKPLRMSLSPDRTENDILHLFGLVAFGNGYPLGRFYYMIQMRCVHTLVTNFVKDAALSLTVSKKVCLPRNVTIAIQ